MRCLRNLLILIFHEALLGGVQLLFLLLLSLFSELLEIDFVLSVHQLAKMIDFGSEKLLFGGLLFEMQVVPQKIGFDEFFLDILDLSDHGNVTRPAWDSLVDLFVLIHDPRLLFEICFLIAPVKLNKISSVVKLLVVNEDISLGEPCFRRLQELIVHVELGWTKNFLRAVDVYLLPHILEVLFLFYILCCLGLLRSVIGSLVLDLTVDGHLGEFGLGARKAGSLIDLAAEIEVLGMFGGISHTRSWLMQARHSLVRVLEGFFNSKSLPLIFVF